MTARFSICIPVWNDAEWIGGAIESVLAQNYRDWELVVGDNASDETVAEAVGQYSDPRIRYHRWDRHVDAYESFNRASQLGKHEWILPISADDRLELECLQTMADRIEAVAADGARVAAVITDCHRVDPEGNPADDRFAGHQRTAPILDGTYDAAQWLEVMSTPRQAPWNIGSIAFSREVMVESGWFRPDVGYGADVELVLRVAAYGSIVYVGEKLFTYTVRDVSDSLSRAVRSLDDPATPLRAAWESAIRAHRMHVPIPREQVIRICDMIARSHIQRGLQHRLWSTITPRRKAAREVGRAVIVKPSILLSPWHVAAASLAVVAPRWTVAWSLRRLTVHRRGPGADTAHWRA